MNLLIFKKLFLQVSYKQNCINWKQMIMFENRIINSNFSGSENHIFILKKTLKNKPVFNNLHQCVNLLIERKELGSYFAKYVNEITCSCKQWKTIGLKKGSGHNMLCTEKAGCNPFWNTTHFEVFSKCVIFFTRWQCSSLVVHPILFRPGATYAYMYRHTALIQLKYPVMSPSLNNYM